MRGIALALIGLATALLSGAALVAEGSHLLTPVDAGLEARVATFVSGTRQPGWATATQRAFVLDCRNTLIETSASPTGSDLARTCLREALDITEANPASSFAWYGAAHAAVAVQDWPAMNRYLLQSHRTGSNEGWIARYRTELAQGNIWRLETIPFERSRQDLALLAGNMDAFAGFLADLYQRYPWSRSVIIQVVEATDGNAQGRFLAAVSTAGSGVSP